MRRAATRKAWPVKVATAALFAAITAGLALGPPSARRVSAQAAPPRRVVYPKFYAGPTTGAVVDGPTHDGKEIQVDLPKAQHVKNFGAPKDGLGLCVFASMTMGGRWHNIRELFDVIHKIEAGGGYPAKVDAVLKQYAPDLKYVQYEGTNPAILDKALSENRIACVTYGYGERYTPKGSAKLETIYHMVDLVHLDAETAAILDNNFPGTYEWMSRAEFLRRWVHPSGQGWAFVFLRPPPPPVPHNRLSQLQGDRPMPAILAAILVGQICLPGTACSSAPTLTYEQPSLGPMLARYRTTYDGLSIVVEGWQFEPGGNIHWEAERPANAAAILAARQAKAARAAAPAKAPRPPVTDDGAARDAADEAAKRDYTDRFGVRHAWPKEPAPVPAPATSMGSERAIGQVVDEIPNYGIQPQFLGSQREHFTAPSEEARRFVQGLRDGGQGDDMDYMAGKVRLTIIGTDEQRKPVLDDLASNPSLVGLKDRILVQDYKPGEWAVDPGLGFQAGTPAILIQSGKTASDPNGGEVLHRAASYAGPEKLAEEIRKANPSYKPELDPGVAPASGGGCPLGFQPKHYLLIGLAIAAVLGICNYKPQEAARA